MSDNYTQDFIDEVKGCRTPSVSGEGGVDLVVREALDEHVDDDAVHYSDQKVIEVTSDVFSNTNLLINSDFKINQRGQTEYNIVDDNENSYSIDCWRSSTGFRITVNDGLAIEPVTACTINTYGAAQVMNAAPFIGKTLTFSADVNTTNDYAFMIMYATSGNGTVVRSSEKLLLEQGINHVTISNIPDTAKKLWVQFTINSGANVGDVLKLNWAKLELGTVATPFTPVDPATELLKCQGYYQQYSIISGGVYAVAVALTAEVAKAVVTLPTTMRIMPSLIFNADEWELYDGSTAYPITDIVLHTNAGQTQLTFNITSESLIVGKNYFIRATTTASVAYSAEL